MSGFQTQVNANWAPGVLGAFASANPVATYVTGPGGLIAAAVGVLVGRFGWTNDGLTMANSSTVATSKPVTTVARTAQGFVANEQQGLFTAYLAESGLTILAGQAMEAFVRGDFWALLTGPNAATINPPQRVFVNLQNGSIAAAAQGSTIAAASMTASFATNVMTVTVIDNQVLTVGDAITGTGVPANTYIESFGTGAGGTGTYNLSTSPGTVASAAGITGSHYIEQPEWKILSAGSVGEIVKIGRGD